MKVEFYRWDGGDGSIKLGEISLVDGRLKATGSLGVRRVLERSSIHGKGGALISRDEPAKFIRALCYEYRSVYFSATKPIQ